jgi:DNA-binding transcriptional MerR regulator
MNRRILKSLKSLQGQVMSLHPASVDLCRIGEAAAASGVSTANIRFYERAGLLAPQTRADNDYRLYSPADLHRLRFIRVCRSMDMSLDEVLALLDLDGRRPSDCDQAQQTIDRHLGHVRHRLKELRALERELQALRHSCDGSEDHCLIIDSLHQRAEAPSPSSTPKRRTAHV